MPSKKSPARKPTARAKAASKPRCGLCGATKNLTRTECCNQWICDDEGDYVLFSYARNSCHRNHSRYTLCAFHFNEGHQGRWQDCQACRDSFETEIYVGYGTNEYNFEVLPNPPAFEPKRCAKCKAKLDLNQGGYAVKGGDYFCAGCALSDLPGRRKG